MIPKHFRKNPQAYDLWQAYTFLAEQADSDWRFGFPASLHFPASEVTALHEEADSLRLDITTPGITGPDGPLPQHIVETIIQEKHEGNRSLQDFFDLLQNRLMRLWMEEAEAMCPELGRIKKERENFQQKERRAVQPAWLDIPEQYRTRLGVARSHLDADAILGKTVFDSDGGIY